MVNAEKTGTGVVGCNLEMLPFLFPDPPRTFLYTQSQGERDISKAVVLTKHWKYLETFLVVTTGAGRCNGT